MPGRMNGKKKIMAKVTKKKKGGKNGKKKSQRRRDVPCKDSDNLMHTCSVHPGVNYQLALGCSGARGEGCHPLCSPR